MFLQLLRFQQANFKLITPMPLSRTGLNMEKHGLPMNMKLQNSSHAISNRIQELLAQMDRIAKAKSSYSLLSESKIKSRVRMKK